MKPLMQYVRDGRNHRVGMVVANVVGADIVFGWSKRRSQHDLVPGLSRRFHQEFGRVVAFQRLEQEPLSEDNIRERRAPSGKLVPVVVWRTLEQFAKRARLYYFKERNHGAD